MHQCPCASAIFVHHIHHPFHIGWMSLARECADGEIANLLLFFLLRQVDTNPSKVMVRNKTDKHLNSFLPDQAPELTEVARLGCLGYHSTRDTAAIRKGSDPGGIYVVVFPSLQLHPCLVIGKHIWSSVHIRVTSRNRDASLFTNFCFIQNLFPLLLKPTMFTQSIHYSSQFISVLCKSRQMFFSGHGWQSG